ncbi:phage tail protein [Lacticaseibacillus daqingensis]|uniref:phage tail protein n=1 Tax=Lacticaseibacillus daqingensis TaxID=2486014 RepID=UPI000F7A60B4|nr:phage tail protein [Lacticaseibacillus daqingensis]
MAVVGVKLVKLALVDDEQKIIAGEDGLSESGIYEIDNKDLGTKSANITGLAGTITKIYGNNTAQDVTTGAAAPTVALDVNNLDFLISQKLKGFTSDGKGGWTDEKKKQHVAMLIQTQSIDRQHNVYFGFGNGLWTESEKNLQTDDADEHRVDDASTYTALDCIAFGHVPYKLYSDFEETFEESAMLGEVFGGYKAEPVSSPK